MKIADILKEKPGISSKRLFETLFPEFLKREKEVYGVVYCFTSPSGKRYIGVSKCWRKRFKNYRGYYCKPQAVFFNALKSHGFDNFDIKILWLCDTKEDMFKMEINFICWLKTRVEENGYNIESGGQRPVRAEATRKKIGETHKRVSYWIGRKMTPEHRKKLSDARKGENHHFWGKKFSPERCAQIRLVQKREKSFMFDKNIYLFFNIKTEERFVGHQYDLRMKYKVCINLIVKKPNRVSKNWIYLGPYVDDATSDEKIKQVVESKRGETKLYRFYHIEKMTELVISQLDFRKRYNLHGGQLSLLINRIPDPRKMRYEEASGVGGS